MREIRRFKVYDANGRSITIVESRHEVHRVARDGTVMLGRHLFTTTNGVTVKPVSPAHREFLVPIGKPAGLTRMSRDGGRQRNDSKRSRTSRDRSASF